MLKIPYTQHEFLALDTYFSSLLRKKANAKIDIIGNPSPWIKGSRKISGKNLMLLLMRLCQGLDFCILSVWQRVWNLVLRLPILDTKLALKN